MKRAVFSTSLLLAAIIGAPASADVQPKTIKSVWVNPFMMMRLHNQINIVTNITFSDNRQVQRWSAIDCTQRQAYQLYWDLLDKEGLKEHRFYGENLARYAPPQPAPEITQEQIAQLCDVKLKEAEWVYVEKKNRWDIPTLIDRANIIRAGESLIVRVGFGYDKISWDPPYDAPYNFKIELHLYHCGNKTDKVVGALDVDPQGRVTDGLIDKEAIRRADSFENTPATVAAFDAICQLSAPSDFRGLGRYVSKKTPASDDLLKPMLPQFGDNSTQWLTQFPLDAALTAQAQKLVKNWAPPKFRRLRWTESDASSDKVSYILDARPDGLMVRLEDYRLFRGQRIMIANAIQLQSALSISHVPNQTRSLDTTLRFPLYQGQRYVITVENGDLGEKEKVNRMTDRCEVMEKGDAHALNTAFSGSYWRVSCEQQNDEGTFKTESAFLNDLNIFLPLKRSVKGKMMEVALSDVTIAR